MNRELERILSYINDSTHIVQLPYRSAEEYIRIPSKRESGGVFYEKVMRYL